MRTDRRRSQPTAPGDPSTVARAAAKFSSDTRPVFTRSEAAKLAQANIDYHVAESYRNANLSVDDTVFAVELGITPSEVAAIPTRSGDDLPSAGRRQEIRYTRYLEEVQTGLTAGFGIVAAWPLDHEAASVAGYTTVTMDITLGPDKRPLVAEVRLDTTAFGTNRPGHVHVARQVLGAGATIQDIPPLGMLDWTNDRTEHVDVLASTPDGIQAWVRFSFERRLWFG